MIEPKSRVRYTPDTSPLSYTHLAGKTGTVMYRDSLDWYMVKFDYQSHMNPLPCNEEELEIIS